MFEAFYYFFRVSELDGIIIFIFLSYVLYILCPPKNPSLTCFRYVASSTAVFILSYYSYHVIPIFKMPQPFSMANAPYWYFFLCLILISMAGSYFYLSSSFVYKLVYILFFITFIHLYKFVCSPLYELEHSIASSLYSIFDLGTIFFLYILLFLFSLLFRNVTLKNTLPITPKKFFLALYFPFSILLCSILVANTSYFYAHPQPIMAFVIMTNLPLIYYFLAQIIMAYEDQRQLDNALTQTQAQLSRYRFSIEFQDAVRKERHELKNKYFYLQTMVREKKYEQLEVYLQNITGEDLSTPSAVDTGNTLLDYLLNRKLKEAHKYQIKTYLEIMIPEQLSVSEDTLCTILLNLLDNALEASQKEEHPELHITMKCVQNYLVCKINNKVSQNVLFENPQFHTTKQNAVSHGLGIKIVESAVKKNNGILHFSMENGYFSASVMLPLA